MKMGDDDLIPSVIDASVLRREIQTAKDALAAGVSEGRFLDIAFIGNASSIYTWEPGSIIDLDVCIFVREKSLTVGTWLHDLRERLAKDFATRNVDFYLRLIKGAYKEAVRVVQRPVLVAHLALFTEDSYLDCLPLIRWAWRKYTCLVEPQRLSRLAPEKPGVDELMESVAKRLGDIELGAAPFMEFTLPEFEEVKWTVGPGDPLFAEHCIMGALVCSRNHARVLGMLEPDRLNNTDFALWYHQTLMPAPELCTLVELKAKARREGYGEIVAVAPALCRSYMHHLYEHLAQKSRQTFSPRERLTP